MKTIYVITAFVATLFAMSLSSCKISIKKGNTDSKMVTKNVDAKDFYNLSIDCYADVYFTVGDTFSVSLQVPEEQQNLYTAKVNDGHLEIAKMPVNSNPTVWVINNAEVSKAAKIYITAPFLRCVSILGGSEFECKDTIKTDFFKGLVQGSGEIKIASLYADTAYVNIMGSGDVKLDRYEGKMIEYSISGSGDIKSKQWNVASTKASIAGSGDMNLDFNGGCDEASVVISGSGDVKLAGEIKNLNESIAGSGNIDKNSLKINR